MRIAVVTIAAGRHQHLRNQQLGLRSGTSLPDDYIVVAMGDPDIIAITEQGPLAATCATTTCLLPAGAHLPLAAARNAGAELAVAAGADVIIFLDVDCIPSTSLVATYAAAVRESPTPALHCGVVRYLGPEVDASAISVSALSRPFLAGEPHTARPNPGPGESLASDSWQLFWSLSFAVSAHTWATLGGFHPEYVGYGAEDTDLGFSAHRAGIELNWVGGADAFHQYHPTTELPVAHLDDILRNAAIFHRRWGYWPMEGWLQGFAEAGLAQYSRALGWRAR